MSRGTETVKGSMPVRLVRLMDHEGKFMHQTRSRLWRSLVGYYGDLYPVGERPDVPLPKPLRDTIKAPKTQQLTLRFSELERDWLMKMEKRTMVKPMPLLACLALQWGNINPLNDYPAVFDGTKTPQNTVLTERIQPRWPDEMWRLTQSEMRASNHAKYSPFLRAVIDWFMGFIGYFRLPQNFAKPIKRDLGEPKSWTPRVTVDLRAEQDAWLQQLSWKTFIPKSTLLALILLQFARINPLAFLFRDGL